MSRYQSFPTYMIFVVMLLYPLCVIAGWMAWVLISIPFLHAVGVDHGKSAQSLAWAVAIGGGAASLCFGVVYVGTSILSAPSVSFLIELLEEGVCIAASLFLLTIGFGLSSLGLVFGISFALLGYWLLGTMRGYTGALLFGWVGRGLAFCLLNLFCSGTLWFMFVFAQAFG